MAKTKRTNKRDAVSASSGDVETEKVEKPSSKKDRDSEKVALENIDKDSDKNTTTDATVNKDSKLENENKEANIEETVENESKDTNLEVAEKDSNNENINETSETNSGLDNSEVVDSVSDSEKTKEVVKEINEENSTNKTKETPEDSTDKTDETSDDSSNNTKETSDDSSNNTKETSDDSSNNTKETSDDSSNNTKETSDDSSNNTKEAPGDSSNKTEEIPDDSDNKIEEILDDSIDKMKETPEESDTITKETPDDSDIETKETPDDSVSETKETLDDSTGENAVEIISEITERSTNKTKKKFPDYQVIDEPTVEDGEWTLESRLESFLKWSQSNGLTLSTKVEVKSEGTSHRYGMLATADIKKGETLFVVPRALLLHPDNSRIVAEIVDYEDWLDSIGQSLDDSSGWATLLISLMLEFNDNNSYWAPYLRLVPKPEEFGHPLFWSSEEHREELKGTTLLYDIQRDIYNIESEYKQYVLPFVYRYRDICGRTQKYNLALYKRLVAFVMAYSFTEDFDSQPAMVPMADLLNHSVNNNAHLVYEDESLRMVSLRKIDKGEEIFNTFGKLGNSELLQMYGYADTAPNIFDTLPILVNTFLDAMEKSEKLPDSYFQAMVTLLNKTEIAPADDFFLFDRNGMRKGPDLLQMLKILFMTENEFEELLQSRAGNRPDSFYQKLLRKLRLAKKTDTSSGVAIIDITDEEPETELPPKRKFIDLHEIVDNDEPPSKHSRIQENIQSIYLQLARSRGETVDPLQLLQQQAKNDGGNSISNAIVIDDDDDDDSDDDGDSNDDLGGEGKIDAEETAPTDKDKSASIDEEEKSTNTDDKDKDSTPNETSKNDKSPSKEGETVKGDEATASSMNGSSESKDEKMEYDNISEDDSAEDKKTKKSNEKNEEVVDKNPENDDKDEKVATDDSKKKKSDTEAPNEEVSSKDKNEKMDDEESEPKEKQNNIEDSKTDSNGSKDNDKEVTPPKDIKSVKVNGEIPSDDVVSIGDDIEDDLDEDIGSHDSDFDEIEFVSEDIRCKMTYESLNKQLKPEWKEFIKSVLSLQLESLKPDEGMTVERAKETMSSRRFYSYQIRQGHRSIVNTFLSALT